MCLLQSLTLFKITKEYGNTRDYSTRSFYTGLLSVRHSPSLSPSLILLTLDTTIVKLVFLKIMHQFLDGPKEPYFSSKHTLIFKLEEPYFSSKRTLIFKLDTCLVFKIVSVQLYVCVCVSVSVSVSVCLSVCLSVPE